MKNGFTIIELIVVIAIIAILAGIVMAIASTIKEKSKDAAIKSELAQLGTLGGEYYIIHNDYQHLCDDGTDFKKLFDTIPAFQDCKASVCKDPNTGGNTYKAWAACAVLNFPLNQTLALCTDSTGVTREICARQCSSMGDLQNGACPIKIYDGPGSTCKVATPGACNE